MEYYMKTEFEVRLLDCNIQKIIKKLKENHATFIGDWLQLRYCYDFNPVQENSWIRLRTNGKETTLTIKEVDSARIDGTKECEIVVSDFATTDEILNKLGYKARSKQENRRIQFKLDGVEIDIDMWPKLAPYVEIEGKNEEEIKKVCKKLDIDYSKVTSLDVQSIYLQHGFDLNKNPIIELEDDKKEEIEI